MTTLWLLLKRMPAVGWLVVGIVAVVCFASASIYESGRQAERASALRVKVKHDTQVFQYWDTVTKTDTVRLTKYVTRYDTLRSVLNIHDTVAVLRFVAIADSTVKQCRETVRDLGLSCAAKDTVIRDLRGLLAIRAPRPLTWKERAAYALAGFAANEAAHRLVR